MPHWTEQAICEPNPVWDADTKPGSMPQLEAICAQCPVEAHCALHALQIEAEAGVFAGVWIPERPHHGKAWLSARKKLHTKAVSVDPEVSIKPRPKHNQLYDSIVFPCGTEAAYRRHLRRNEPPCNACRIATTRARDIRKSLANH